MSVDEGVCGCKYCMCMRRDSSRDPGDCYNVGETWPVVVYVLSELNNV
jgi:hypothetical protein